MCGKKLQQIIYFASLPIIEEFSFFLLTFILQVLPIFMYSYYNCETICLIDVVNFKVYVHTIPFIFYVPFVISYFFSLFLCIINKKYFMIKDFVRYLIILSLFILNILNIFLLIHFQTMLTPSMIQLYIETNNVETREFFMNYVLNHRIVYVLINVVLLLFMAYILRREQYRIKMRLNNIYIKIVICAFIFYFTISSFSQFSLIVDLLECKNTADMEYLHENKYNPSVGLLSNFIYSIYFEYLSKRDYKKEIIISERVSKEKQFSLSNEKLNIIVVIGESFNKYHSSLYGYKYKTNPLLTREKNMGNLFVFSNVVSPFNLTSSVLKNVFSTNCISNREYWYDKPLFPVIFKSSGYKVFFWDNQKSDCKASPADFSLDSFLYNYTISKLSYDFVNHCTFLYDGDLIHDFNLNKNINCINNNLFIFHLMGQHVLAADRYPKNKGFDVFNVDSFIDLRLSREGKSYVSDYANATLYNDYVISKIINIFKKKNSIMIYFSDHGEEVYDFREYAGRTHEHTKSKNILKYQYEIPFMIWCSDKYIRCHKNEIAMISTSTNKPFMIDNLSHLLFGLGKIKTSYYNSKCDLLNKEFVSRPRIVQDLYDFDKIMNK